MKEYETILKTLAEKIERLERDVFIKDFEIEQLKKQLEEAKKNDK